MKLLVTGATGFLGKHVVAAACARGHEVRALVRPAARSLPDGWALNPLIEPIRGDLRVKGGIAAMLDGVDAILHLAAAKSGDLYDQFAGTVIASENLLEAMQGSAIQTVVLTSTFSVYEYEQRRSWSVLDEQSPLAAEPRLRDEYCQTKLVQEALVREACQTQGRRCIVLRPGVIFGRDNLWTARLGLDIGGRWWVRTGALAPLPLTYVENCAEAIVIAAEYQSDARELVLNVVDDATPSQRAYMAELKRAAGSRARIVPVPWWAMRGLAGLVSIVNRVAFSGTAKVPAIFRTSALCARCRPLRYDASKIRRILGWHPRWDWREGIRRSLAPAATELTRESEDTRRERAVP